MSPEFLKAMKTLKGCMQQYPEVLIPEKTKVYRGLTLPAKYFIDLKIEDSFIEINSNTKELGFNFILENIYNLEIKEVKL